MNALVERIMKDAARRTRFYAIASFAKPPISEAEADRLLERWKQYGKTLFNTATAAELFVKDAMDQVIAASQPKGSLSD